MKKRNKKIKKILPIAATAAVCAVFLLWRNKSDADDSISQLSQGANTTSASDTQAKLDELNRRAEIYKQIIDLKRQQGATLNNQISLMDANIQQVQTQIDANKKQIDDLNSQISYLQQQIQDKQSLIDSQKKLLANLVQSYYEINQTDLTTIYLSKSDLTAFAIAKDQAAQTGDKIVDMVSSLIDIQKQLNDQSKAIDQKKSEVVTAHDTLQDKNVDLQSSIQQKQNLLAKTKGDEVKYQQLLQNVEAQKQELLDIDQFFAASGLSADSYPKPDSKYFAPASWYFSQRDPQWGNATIGNSNTLIKSYGCAVAAVAMVLVEHGYKTNPGILAKQPIFSWDLISWPNSFNGSNVQLSSAGKSHGNIDWSVIDAQIAKGNPVIVFIKRTAGGTGHYVVIHHKTVEGKYVVHDPYFGPNIYLDTTRALVGAMGTSSSTVIDQMIIYN